MTEVFVGDVYHTAIRDGKDLYTAASEAIKPGLLILITSGSSASKAGASDAPVAVARNWLPSGATLCATTTPTSSSPTQ